MLFRSRLVKEVTAQVGKLGGYFFLFFKDLNEQTDNANDQNAGLNKIGICDHCQPPFLYDQEAKKRPPI